jgi:hypothetical protein
VKLQPVHDLVDYLALGAHRDLDETELGAEHRPHHLAVGGIMRDLDYRGPGRSSSEAAPGSGQTHSYSQRVSTL